MAVGVRDSISLLQVFLLFIALRARVESVLSRVALPAELLHPACLFCFLVLSSAP